ncbi:MAG TPA: hypothetical protein PL037_08600, partial [Elusimicrobiales bacterium]|nr:hypothetical protein [Elusimicrobiales bacterium]
VSSSLGTVSDTIDVWSTLYTGLDVRSGQTINISASGIWRVNGVDVNATGSGTGMYNGVVYNAPVGALIARVGESSPWFYVGTSTSLVHSGPTGQLQLHMNANYNFGTGTWNYPYGVSGQLYVDYSVLGDTHAVLSGTVTYSGAAAGGSNIIVNARAYVGAVETIIATHTIPLPLTGGTSFYTMRGIEIPYGGDSAYVTLRAYVDTDPSQFGTGPGDINVRIGQPAVGGNVTVYPGAGVVIGTVTYPSGAQQFGDIVVALFSSLGGEPVASTTIPSGVSTFSITGVPGPAFYRVFAFRDVNYDGKPNGPEPFGYYGTAGALSAMDVNASTVSVAIGAVSTVPVVIALQDMGQINGRVDLGSLSSPVRVVVQAGHGMPGSSFQVENWMDYQATPCWWTYCVNEVWYDVGTLTPGSDYTVVAFLDKNGNGQWDCASSETCERFSSSRNNISVTANAIAQADIVMSS